MQENRKSSCLWMRGVLAFGIGLLAFAVFWPGSSGGYIFDDYSAILGNPAVRMTELTLAQFQATWGGFDLGGFGRPLAMLTFGLNHLVAGGFDPFGFKLTGLIVHAVNAALVLLLLERVFALLALPRLSRLWLAALLAALWAVHPLQVSTALYVVQRMEMLATTFVLLSLLAYLAGRVRQIEGRNGWGWIALSLALIVPGVLSKETAVLFPVYTLVLELSVLGFAAKSPALARAWRWFYLTATVIAVLGYVLLYLPKYGSLDPWASRGFDSVERMLTQLRVLPLYLQQILVPVPSTMTFYYDDVTPSRGLFHPWTTAAGLVLLVSLLVGALALRKRIPLFSLGVLWFFGAHILSSNAQSLELVFEHRNYFALLGVLLATFGVVREAHLRLSPRLVAFIGVILVVGVGALGLVRAATWGNPLLLATHQVAINPESARAKVDLGVIYYGMANGSPESPFFSFALRTFEEAANLPQGDVQASTNLILMRLGLGQSVSDEDWGALYATLRNGPVSPQSASAVWTLFENRNEGRGMQPDRLLEVVKTLFEKRDQAAFRYAQVGDYLREEVQRPDTARRYYLMAAERAQGESPMIKAVIDKLIEEGEFAWAAEVGQHARSHGVALDPR